MKGVVIAGTGSGVGKTSITTGILSGLSKRYKVQPFKAGPDFIDTMYHSAAAGRPSRNLDSFMMCDDTLKNLVGFASADADVCVVEGVRGLYEGFAGDSDMGSTAYLSKLLGFPIILIVDASSLTRSAAAIVNGFKSFDPDVKIGGVILNNVSGKQHSDKLKTAMDTYTDTKLIGMIKKDNEHTLEQRYLGLTTIEEFDRRTIAPLEVLTETLDLDAVMDVAEHCVSDLPTSSPYVKRNSGLKAAVPMDRSYCFYYKENIECLEASGIDIETFRPTDGDPVPDADIYYLGGGYPELHAGEISENEDFITGLKNASLEGKIILGECGGLMTMCNNIVDASRNTHRMSGIFDAEAIMTNKRHGPTYVISQSTPGNPLFKDKTAYAHEYHYSDVFPNKKPEYGFEVRRGTGIHNGMDGLISQNSLGMYMHQHALSMTDWAKDLVDAACRIRN